ncbi:MAG: AsnC family transcriptional regulator [Nitrososphaerales archaeon]
MWAADKSYSDLMKELWGSPGLWSRKKTYVEIARKLGVDEETVRNKVKVLKESGFLHGWKLLPNLALLGRSSYFVSLEFRNEEEKEQAIPKIAQQDGVIIIANIYGSSLLVTMADDPKLNLAKKVSALAEKAESFVTPGMNLPGLLSFKMTKTDWQIIKLLLRDAERKVTEIAKEVKLSTKSVNRRLNEMMNSRAIFIMPVVDLRKAGGISYHLLVEAGEGKKSEVDEAVSSKIPNLVFRASAAKNDLIFGFNGTNIAEGSEILKLVKKIPEVKSAKLNIVENVVHVYDWIEKEVEKRVAVG